MSLDFLNKNCLRRYPFSSTVSRKDETEVIVPDAILSDLNLVTTSGYENVFISKITVNEFLFSIELKHQNTVLAWAKGLVERDYQPFSLTGAEPFCSGFVTIGLRSAFSGTSTHVLTETTGLVEPSLITVIARPGVSKIKHESLELTGLVELDLTNLRAEIGPSSLTFSVISPGPISSLRDKTSGEFTCTTSVITGINGVKPNPTTGNIDIFAIKPLEIGVGPGGGISFTSPDVSLESLCKKANIPPLDPTNEYDGDIVTNLNPEWKGWPQYEAYD